MISARLVPQACVAIPFGRKNIDAAGAAADPAIAGLLRGALLGLVRAIEAPPA
jgi:hypothetical protein